MWTERIRQKQTITEGHIWRLFFSFDGCLSFICSNTKSIGLGSLYVASYFTHFIHQRSLKSKKDEGPPAVCAGSSGGEVLHCTAMYVLCAAVWKSKSPVDSFLWQSPRGKTVLADVAHCKFPPARSWPWPPPEDCLLSPCQHDTVSNRTTAARAGHLHSSQNLTAALGWVRKPGVVLWTF